MTQQHTPGPWFASKDGWSNGTVTHNLPTGHIGQICHVQCTGAKTQSEGNANARLIAAAPELLEIVQKLVTLCPSSEGLGGHAPIQAFIQLGESARKILIEKIEG